MSTDGDKYAFVNAQVKGSIVYRLMCTTCILELTVLEGERDKPERRRDCAKNKERRKFSTYPSKQREEK